MVLYRPFLIKFESGNFVFEEMEKPAGVPRKNKKKKQ